MPQSAGFSSLLTWAQYLRLRALEHSLDSCGVRAYWPRSMWDLPGPGIEPASPALAGRFFITGAPGKPLKRTLLGSLLNTLWFSELKNIVSKLLWCMHLLNFCFIIYIHLLKWASLLAQTVKHLPVMWKTRVQSLGWEDPVETGMATHSSILAWRIPRTEEPGRLQSMGGKE